MSGWDEFVQRKAHEKRIRRRLRDLPEYKLRVGDTCPQCGYGVVVEGPVVEAGPLDFCFACQAMWEREERKHPTLECCSKCAFLPGSPEQRNHKEWRTIVENTVKANGKFLCHKRVPFDLLPDGTYNYKHRDGSEKVLYGTLCHGWIKAKCSVLLKDGSR